MITADLLRTAVGCTAERAEAFAGPLFEACALFEINTPIRLAMFLANIGHESASLAKQRESMDYAADRLVPVFGPHRITAAQADAIGGKPGRPADQQAIANQVYGGAWGAKNLGNTEPGDGWRYRAAGPIGTTGRANFRELKAALLLAGYDDVPDFEAEPERLTEPRWGAAAAGHFWASRNLNAWADRGDFLAVCRGINLGSPKSSGTPNGMADREQRLARARAALAALQKSAPAQAPSQTTAAAPAPVRGIPAGEFIPEEPPMAPFIMAALQAVLPAVPKLIETFGSGSEVSKRNEKAAEVVVAVAKEALGAVNEQDLAERMRTDPEAPAKVRAAVEEKWFAIMDEAGSGGIEGARKADAATRAAGDLLHSASFWVAMLLLPLVYLLVLSLIGLVGSATWSDDVRAGLAGSLISAIVGGLVGYYYGQTTSRNRA